ncbi:MAG: hypothetical protein NT120_04905 [Candidatus Aenigmarchaeota archaeon]|nr:hypothetical protein [Candidatus Aenigmarchaeota archaeon]
MLAYNKDLLQQWDGDPQFEKLLKRLPVEYAMKKIVEEGSDDVVINPGEEHDTLGFKMRMYLDKSTAPPLIVVHLNDQFACRLFYGDEDFAKTRSNPRLVKDAGFI